MVEVFHLLVDLRPRAAPDVRFASESADVERVALALLSAFGGVDGRIGLPCGFQAVVPSALDDLVDAAAYCSQTYEQRRFVCKDSFIASWKSCASCDISRIFRCILR